MAEHLELAKAYIQIVPTTDGIQKSLEKELSGAGESAGKKAGNSIASGISSVAGAITKAAVAGLTAATGAAIAFAKESVETGAEFDKAMSQVQATMLKTSEEMENEVGSVSTAYGDFEGNLREFAQFLGENTAFSATQAAEALNYMALAGYNTQESMEMLPNVLSLAAAGGFDLARASDMVTDTQTAFGISAERTTQLVDEMAKAASTGNTTVEMLGDAFLVVGGLAQDLNGGLVTLADGTQTSVDGIQELEIALTAMANAGIKGSEAGTHMRNMLLKLSSPTNDGAAALEALGVSVFDTEGNMRSLCDIFTDLKTGMEGITQEEKLQAISDIFNTRDVASAEALLSAVDEDWDAIGASILQAEGSAAEMANIQLDNLSGDITLFQSALEGTKIALSDALTPALREFVEFGTGSLGGITEALKQGDIDGAIDAAVGVVGNAADMVMQKLPKIMEVGGKLLKGLMDAIVKNLPKVLPELAKEVVSFVKDLLKMVINVLPGLASEVISIATDLLEMVINALPELVVMLVDALPVLIPQLINGLVRVVSLLMVRVGDIILPLIEALPGILSSIGVSLLANLPILLGGLANLIGQLVGAIPQFLADIPGIVLGVFSQAWDILSEFFLPAGQWFEEHVTKPLVEMFDNMGMAIAEFFSGMWDGLKNGAKLAWQAVKDTFSKVADWFKDIFSKAWQKVKDVFSVGGKIFDGIKDGIVNAFKTVVNGIIRGINKIITVPFNAINGVLEKIHDINILGIAPFSWVKTFSVPQIPELAAGGVIGSPQLIMAGEEGREAIVPLERNTGWIRSVAAELSEEYNSGAMQEIADEVRELSEKIDRIRVVLDSGELVGGISEEIDRVLGRNAGYVSRGVAFA